MGAYTTLAVSSDQYKSLIELLRNGNYTDLDGVRHEPNPRIAEILQCEYNLGIRVSDIVKLKLSDIVKDGERYRLDIVEKKTKKARKHTVPTEYYEHLKSYCESNGIGMDARIFPIQTRTVQKQIRSAREYLGFEDVSTHSFRKSAGNDIYEATGHDIEAVREFYQHKSTVTTQTYLKRSTAQLERAIAGHTRIV